VADHLSAARRRLRSYRQQGSRVFPAERKRGMKTSDRDGPAAGAQPEMALAAGTGGAAAAPARGTIGPGGRLIHGDRDAAFGPDSVLSAQERALVGTCVGLG